MNAIPIIPGETLLYKFRALDNEEHVKFAADILLNHRLFAAPPKLFNDPFDCDAPYSFEAAEEEKTARAVARIKRENPRITEAQARCLAPGRCRGLEETGAKTMREWVETKLGVVSLAENITSPLLWAHYASSHTGISIEFFL